MDINSEVEQAVRQDLRVEMVTKAVKILQEDQEQQVGTGVRKI